MQVSESQNNSGLGNTQVYFSPARVASQVGPLGTGRTWPPGWKLRVFYILSRSTVPTVHSQVSCSCWGSGQQVHIPAAGRRKKQSAGVSSLKGSEKLPQALSVDIALGRTWSAVRALASRRMENSLHF